MEQTVAETMEWNQKSISRQYTKVQIHYHLAKTFTSPSALDCTRVNMTLIKQRVIIDPREIAN